VANRETKRTGENIDDVHDEWGKLSVEHGYGEMIDNPEEFIEQCGDEVYKAMRKLSTSERSCFMLRVIDHLSYQEIADSLSIPFGTVMTHLARGRIKLRRELLEHARQNGIVKRFFTPVSIPEKNLPPKNQESAS